MLLIAGAESAAQANDEPRFEAIDLFKAGQDGYHTYRIPAMAITRKGTVLVACAARYNSHSDWANIDTMLRRSTDGGQSWSEQEVVTDDGRNVVDNATFVVTPNSDTVYLLYQINYARAYLKTSRNEGETWSAPQEITGAFQTFRERDGYQWTVLAMGPGHGLTLKSGRLVVPVWLSLDRSHRPSIAATIYSDDEGATWHAGQIIAESSERVPNPSEHELVELADGMVMSNLRTESPAYRRLISTSRDGISGWSPPKFDQALYDPICMASMICYRNPPAHGERHSVLFANPDSSATPLPVSKRGGRTRRNLTVRLSHDAGGSWPFAKVVEPGPSGYSDLAVDADGTIFLLYERSATENPTGSFIPEYITIAKFNLAWLTSTDHEADESSTRSGR